MEAFQVFFYKEDITTSQKKDLLHVKKNTASHWLFSYLKELKNTQTLVTNSFKFLFLFIHAYLKHRMKMHII